VHLYKIYISPVLIYGLELILPTTSSLFLLENFQKKILKQIDYFATRFQRRRILKISQSETRVACGGHVC
jgi:hypothetical protein